MFHRQKSKALSTTGKPLKDLLRHLSAQDFLSKEKRQALLQKIQENMALEASRYESLCFTLIENLVHYCQSLPETTNSYYAQEGGLVDHALNRTEAALSLFAQFVIEEDSLTEEQLQWQYALFSAAILQGIGKLFVDYRVDLFDIHGKLLKTWNPLLGNMMNSGSYYDYEFQKESDIEFRRRLNLLMARALMPASGFAWIASNPQVLAVWLALLNEDQRAAGTLGAILIRADALAIHRYFMGLLDRNSSLRGGRFGRTGTFSGSVPPESLLEKEQLIGVEFIQWLHHALESGAIVINRAPLFMVPEGFLMCQEIFELFSRDHPDRKWQAVQNGVLSLGIHFKNADGSFISRFEQSNKQQMYSGIVISERALALPESVRIMQLNTGKEYGLPALEVQGSQFSTQLTQQQVIPILPLQQLNASGQWQNRGSLTAGIKRG